MADVVAAYREAVARANEVIAATTDLAAPAPPGRAVPPLGVDPHDRGDRQARGPRRLLRELIDGATGR